MRYHEVGFSKGPGQQQGRALGTDEVGREEQGVGQRALRIPFIDWVCNEERLDRDKESVISGT